MSDCRRLADAIRREVLRIHNMVAARDTFSMNGNVPLTGPMAPRFSPDQVYAMLRVEVTHETISNLYRDRDSFTYMPPPLSSRQRLTFMGISLYKVEHWLPEPGWKIINPMFPDVR